MIEIKEVIIINNSKKAFIKKISIRKLFIRRILYFFKYLFKKKISNEEKILKKVADTIQDEQTIYNYLATKYLII